MSSIDRVLLHLSLIKYAGPSLIGRLLKTIGPEQLVDLYQWTVSDIMHHASIQQKYAEYIVAGLADNSLLDHELELIERGDATWISLLDKQYPEFLRHTYCPPVGLYVRGSIQALQRQNIAVVGSRDAGDYAQRVVESLIPTLVHHDFVIVSGGARGVDAMAHEATCDVAGQTVVVQGSGLLNLYPPTNRKLFDRVLQYEGALVSIFPMATTPRASLFPIRNRVIAGMSRGTVVVQAASKSGAKITANLALQEGRDVFAVPGSVFDPLSKGCHELLAQGAIVTTSAQDVLVHYGYVSLDKEDESGKSEIKETQGDIFSSDASPAYSSGILVLCKNPLSFDELLDKTGKSFQELQDELFTLQCAGVLQQNFMGLWQRS